MTQQEYTPYGKNGKGNGKATVNDGLSIANALLKLKEEFDSVGTKFNGLTWQRIEKAMQSYSDQQNAELREKLMLLEDTIKHQSERCLRMEDVITELKADVDHNFKRALEIADEREEAWDKVQDLEAENKRLTDLFKDIVGAQAFIEDTEIRQLVGSTLIKALKK